MRYIPSYCLREGMFLARNIYGGDGSLLLRSGQRILPSGIGAIMSLGVQGVYIFDDLSEGIEAEGVLEDEAYKDTVAAVRNAFLGNKGPAASEAALHIIEDLVGDIVDDVCENPGRVVDISGYKASKYYTFFHCANVAVLCVIVAAQMGYPKDELHKLGVGAALHDVGNTFVSRKILEKEGRLSEHEYDKMQQHTLLGYDYVSRRFDLPEDVGRGVLEHHEKLDGSGYPNHMEGNDIGPFARLIAVTDIYDALTSDRPFRRALPPNEALEYLMAGSGTLFDPQVVQSFTRRVAAFPTGSCLRLSNGMLGLVVKNYQDASLRPKVRVLYPKNSEPPEIDLRNDPNARNITVLGFAPF